MKEREKNNVRKKERKREREEQQCFEFSFRQFLTFTYQLIYIVENRGKDL